jgi:hypothetical protein
MTPVLASAREVVEQELDRLTRLGGGTLPPVDVVNSARSPKSPLHRYFEWNDAIAGEAYRLDQARMLIRSVRVSVIYEQTTLIVPRYRHNPELTNGEAGYCELMSIPNDAQKLRVIVSEMRTGMAHLRRAGSIALAIDNAQLHDALSREVARIERYMEALLKVPLLRKSVKSVLMPKQRLIDKVD